MATPGYLLLFVMPRRQTNKQTERQTDRQTDKQTDRQTDRHTDKQTDKSRASSLIHSHLKMKGQQSTNIYIHRYMTTIEAPPCMRKKSNGADHFYCTGFNLLTDVNSNVYRPFGVFTRDAM